MRLLAAFCVFAALASGFAAITLAFPGTALDVAWSVNPQAHEGLRALGAVAVAGMATLSLIAATTAIGVLARKRWAWWIAVVGIAVNGVSDLTTALVSGEARTLIGVPIAALVLWWLTRPSVRARFR